MSDVYGQAEALSQVETELASVMTFSGVDYPCTIGSRTDKAAVGFGGYEISAGLEVVCRRALFATLPTAEDSITVNSKVQKITSVMLPPDESFIVLNCEDINADA